MKSNKLNLLGLAVLAVISIGCGTLTPVNEPSPSTASVSTQSELPGTNTPMPTTLPIQDTEASGAIQATSDNINYGVILVEETDTLNVRSGPGIENNIVGDFPPIFAAIEITGEGVELDDGALWVPIKRLETEGWVNRYFLTEVVTSDAFCVDLRVEELLRTMHDSIAVGNGNQLASLVHPQRGLLIRLNWWNEEVRLMQDEVRTIFSNSTSRNWGNQQGSGNPITGTASEVVIPLLEADLLAEHTVSACNEIVAANTAGLVTRPLEYTGINYYSVHRPAPNQEEDIFDWGTWAIGVEYWNGQPYLTYLIHYEWEI